MSFNMRKSEVNGRDRPRLTSTSLVHGQYSVQPGMAPQERETAAGLNTGAHITTPETPTQHNQVISPDLRGILPDPAPPSNVRSSGAIVPAFSSTATASEDNLTYMQYIRTFYLCEGLSMDRIEAEALISVSRRSHPWTGIGLTPGHGWNCHDALLSIAPLHRCSAPRTTRSNLVSTRRAVKAEKAEAENHAHQRSLASRRAGARPQSLA